MIKLQNYLNIQYSPKASRFVSGKEILERLGSAPFFINQTFPTCLQRKERESFEVVLIFFSL